MQRGPLSALLCSVVLLAVACPRPPLDGEEQVRWRAVLDLKRQALAAPSARKRDARQQYADALAAFVRQHPKHGRAAEVYQDVKLDFAMELVRQGRYEDAIHHFRAILAIDPACREAGIGLAEAANRMTVTREELAAIQKGMKRADVERLLGAPRNGWVRTVKKDVGTTECWYYRGADGGLASVFIGGGRVFATDYSASDARATPNDAMK